MARHEWWDRDREGVRGERIPPGSGRTYELRGGEGHGGRDERWEEGRRWGGEERWQRDEGPGRERWAGGEDARFAYRGREEQDPPWVERGPEARGRRESRGLYEWEDRGPLKWLGDKFREATGRAGRGPKGYQRSDERIRDDVCEQIARSGLDASDVEVTVHDREVTLTGLARSRSEKWALEDIAEDVFGVDDVHNELRVRRGAEAQGTTPGAGMRASHGGTIAGTGTGDAAETSDRTRFP